MIIHAITPQSMMFFIDGTRYQIHNSHPNFQAAIEAVRAGDGSLAIQLSHPIEAVKLVASALTVDVADTSGDEKFYRRKAGVLKVTDWGVTLDGHPIHGAVIDRLLAAVRGGHSTIEYWKNFVQKLYQNPLSSAREELYLWLETSDLPITPDGDFLAFKRVRSDYTDIHSGTFDNSVGQIVSMPRAEVDDNRNNTCSAGLHFCSASYLPSFASSSCDRVVMVKVNPADVVSIPSDYNNAKGRTWRYEVVADVTDDWDTTKWSSFTNESKFLGQSGLPVPADDDNPEDDYNDTNEGSHFVVTTEEEPELTLGNVFAAYRRHYKVGNTETPADRSVRLFRASLVLQYLVSSFNELDTFDFATLISAWK
jgi:hypothetical protein